MRIGKPCSQALESGVIDMLCTDHAPHAAYEKEVAFAEAPCGISGLDTALALTWDLVDSGGMSLDALLRAWCYAPAAAFEAAVQPVRATGSG